MATPKGNVSTEQSSTSTSKSGSPITVNYKSKIKLMNIGEMLDPKTIFDIPCKDRLDVLDVWSKKFGLKTIHIGVKKLV